MVANDRVYYLSDVNHNITALVGKVEGQWQVVERYAYLPYGGVTVYDKDWVEKTGGTDYQNTILFAGRELDPETGLYYNRARYYDAALGRFISRDPWGYVDGPNVYAYCGDNPINRTDPSGLEFKVAAQTSGGSDNRSGVTSDSGGSFYGDRADRKAKELEEAKKRADRRIQRIQRNVARAQRALARIKERYERAMKSNEQSQKTWEEAIARVNRELDLLKLIGDALKELQKKIDELGAKLDDIFDSLPDLLLPLVGLAQRGSNEVWPGWIKKNVTNKELKKMLKKETDPAKIRQIKKVMNKLIPQRNRLANKGSGVRNPRGGRSVGRMALWPLFLYDDLCRFINWLNGNEENWYEDESEIPPLSPYENIWDGRGYIKGIGPDNRPVECG